MSFQRRHQTWWSLCSSPGVDPITGQRYCCLWVEPITTSGIGSTPHAPTSFQISSRLASSPAWSPKCRTTRTLHFMSVKRKTEETDKDGNAHFKSVKWRIFGGVLPMSWFLMRCNFGMSRCSLTSQVPRYKRLRRSRWANPELWRKVLSMTEIFGSCRTTEWEEVWAKGKS